MCNRLVVGSGEAEWLELANGATTCRRSDADELDTQRLHWTRGGTADEASLHQAGNL